jgi:hypothetical protein
MTTLLSTGCAEPEANGVLVTLAPEVISSNDGTLHVRALVVDDRTPVKEQDVKVTAEYTDRNGDAHTIAEVAGKTDQSGAFEAVLTGFDWEGSGTVTVTAVDGSGAALTTSDGPIAGTATFAVLDRTPPVVTILPPTSDMRVGPGLPLEVQVQVQDEIGVSEVFLEADGELNRLRSTVVASGSTDATVTFDFDIPDNALPGPTITLYAMASDLSGNLAAATPITLTVDPAIAVATASGLSGSILADGNQDTLDDPTALAVSPKDGLIYVADNSGGGTCQDACIRAIDPANGNIQSGAVVLGNGRITGVAFDSTGDTLFYSDVNDRIMFLTYNATNSAYENPQACIDIGAQNPQDPWHLVHDPTLGLLTVDQQDDRIKQQVTCSAATEPNDFTNDLGDRPWGIALDAAGAIYVSDEGQGRIVMVDRTNGNSSVFENRNLDEPHGIVWMAGGTSPFADSLLVADFGDRRVASTKGSGPRGAVFLRNRPTDVAVDSNRTLYVLTRPGNNEPGRVFKVTGF